MIETDLPKLLPDLTEVENLFSDYGEVKIKHLSSKSIGNLYDKACMIFSISKVEYAV